MPGPRSRTSMIMRPRLSMRADTITSPPSPPYFRALETRFTSTCRIMRRSATRGGRSEEHTSELQSLMRISYAVFCLKKKTRKTHINQDISKDHRQQLQD